MTDVQATLPRALDRPVTTYGPPPATVAPAVVSGGVSLPPCPRPAIALPDARQQRYLRVKRVTDVALILIFAPLVLPVAAAIALALLLTSGPGAVVFSQMRTGQHGHRFRMLKFTSMVRNAAELKEQLAHLNVLPPPDFKIPNDPRITKLGRILRKTSLDELPQLLNVLRGDMTLVGPRPTSFAASTYSPWHTARLEVPPGITGLWQIKGRGEISFDERLRLDIEYIRGMSPLLDAKIVFGTFSSMLHRKGV